MSVQNTHAISTSLLHFSSILYINKCIIAIYLIFFGHLCITGEYGGFRKLCGDVTKKRRHVVTFQRCNEGGPYQDATHHVPCTESSKTPSNPSPN